MEPDVVRYGAPRDRRSGKRILTVRNAVYFVSAVVVLFIIASFISEMRKPSEGEYGRLYAKRAREVEVTPRAPMVVIPEGQVPESAGADPLLLDGARRTDLLGDTTSARTSPATSASSADVGQSLANEAAIEANRQRRRKGKIVISGGPEGVQLQVKP